ncbi:MAG: VWA domain-containing protein [Actinomycetia bacterium]|nr:VWA domain-containing protein [Actinomycetes bacterium]
MTEPTVFRSVDIGAFAATLTSRLRGAGLEIGLTATERFSQALTQCPPTDRSTLYWVARTCLLHDRSDLTTFDEVFAAVFDGDGLPIDRGRRNPDHSRVTATGTVLSQSAPTDGLTIMTGRIEQALGSEIVDNTEPQDEDDDGSDDTLLPEILPSPIAELADTPFDELNPADLELIARWFEEVSWTWPTRRSRRNQSGRRGPTDLRRTLQASRSAAGEPIRLLHRRARRRRRPLVMVADVSGSMVPFVRVYLHLMRSLVVHGDAEVFTLSTSLHRATVALRESDPEVAIDRISTEVTERFSGTRIATSLKELLTSPVWSSSLRGAVVLIASDGWDTDPPEELEQQMMRLRRMAHRVIWVNPRAADQHFEPAVAGMAAALPWVDSFLSGHSVNAMRQVIRALSLERPS